MKINFFSFKRTLLTLASLLTLSVGIQAEVLLTEHFAQTTETLATNENAFSNEIAATGWTNINGSGNIYMNTTTDLTYAGYKTATDNTGSAEYKATFGKKVAAPLAKTVNSGSVYVAAIMDITACQATSAPARDYLWALCNSTSSISTATNHFGRLCVEKTTDSFKLGIAKHAESPAFLSYTDELSFGKYLVIVEYKFVDGAKNDIIYLYLNPTKGSKPTATLECKQYAENAGGSDVGSGTKDDAAQFSSFMLYSTASTKLALTLDELKIATDWADLWEEGGTTPQDPTPVLSVSATTISYGEIEKDQISTEKTFTVSGTDLKGDITISSSNSELVVTPTTIEKADAGLNNLVTLTLTAETVGEQTATVTISSEDAESKTVAVSWTCVDSSIPVPAITLSAETVDFGTLTLGETSSLTQTLTVKAENLTEDITITGATSELALSAATISKADAESTEGATLTLTLTPASAGKKTVTLTFASADAESKTATITWIAKNPQQDICADNLFRDPSFEDYTISSSMFGTSVTLNEWEDVNGMGGAIAIEPNDVLNGENSILFNLSTTQTMHQRVQVGSDYQEGDIFELTINYKVLTTKGTDLTLDCYWEPKTGSTVDPDELKQHDADKLQQALTSVVGEWKTLTVQTTKPAEADKFLFGLKIVKGAKILVDNFCFRPTGTSEPRIMVSPTTFAPASVDLASETEKQVGTLTLKHNNTTGTTKVYIGGTQREHFYLKVGEQTGDEFDLDATVATTTIDVYYKPTAVGSHSAIVFFDNSANSTLNPDGITIKGNATNSSITPTLSVSPAAGTLDFGTIEAGSTTTQTITVTSENIASSNYEDWPKVIVSHVKGSGFRIESSLIARNTTADVVITFIPQEEGDYESILTVSCTGVAETYVFTLKGSATAKPAGDIDWKTTFNFDLTNPLKLLVEPFDDVEKNKTIVKTGWQNVAAADARPWWGAENDEGGKYAKASAYQFGKESTGDWDMWLVTPALDYKNAESKWFTFSVMGEYLSDNNAATFGVYYIDATDPEDHFVQDLSAAFSLPTGSDDNGKWNTFYLNLEGQEETISDVFFIAFRYTGPNGTNGAVTYYVDDVSWGRTDIPTITANPRELTYETLPVPEASPVAIGTINITTNAYVTSDITLTLAGSRPSDFTLSQKTLPKTGGTVTVYFHGEEAGVHEAYLQLSATDAPAIVIPLAVNVKTDSTGIETLQKPDLNLPLYNVLGIQVGSDYKGIVIQNGKKFLLQ